MPNKIMPAAMEFFSRAQEQVRNSRGKQGIGVRAIEVLLYIWPFFVRKWSSLKENVSF